MTAVAAAAPEDPERRRVRRMNGRNQINDAQAKLAGAIQNLTQTYIEVATGLQLEEDPEVAQTLSVLASAAEQAIDKIESQLDKDLMREQREQ